MPLSPIGELARVGLALADHLGQSVELREISALVEDVLFGAPDYWNHTRLGTFTPREAAQGLLDRILSMLLRDADHDRWSGAHGTVPWESLRPAAEAVFAIAAGQPRPEPEIKVLPGLLAVRRRPGMYVGRTDSTATLTTMLGQVMCCALDQVATGECTIVEVTLHDDGSASVSDNGPGLDVTVAPRHGISTAELLMTALLACRREKVDRSVGDRHCTVGMAAVNALSEWCILQVRRAGTLWEQRYSRGESQGPLANRGIATTSGTCIRFKPDAMIFPGLRFDHGEVEGLVAGLRDECPCATFLVHLVAIP